MKTVLTEAAPVTVRTGKLHLFPVPVLENTVLDPPANAIAGILDTPCC